MAAPAGPASAALAGGTPPPAAGIPESTAGAAPSVLLASTEDGDVQVQGSITDPEGDPIEGVVIAVTGPDGFSATATTDADGNWAVPVPGSGSYPVTIGPSTLPEDVTLTDPDKTELSVTVFSNSKTVIFPTGEAAGGGSGTLARAVQLTVDGLVFGLILALAGVGLSLVFGTTGLTNFAHGHLITFGAVMAWIFNNMLELPFLLAAGLAVLLSGAFGWLQDTDNPALASASGIDVERVINRVWIIGTALAGLAGVVYSLNVGVFWLQGFQMLLLVFAGVILGGLGTAFGALVGSLVADEITAGYLPGIDILRGCDFYAADGELVGIIGPNGAGKSTLLKALFGLVRIRTGTVTLRGDVITNLRADKLVAKGVGFVPQTNNVFPSLTIEENLQMGAYQEPHRFAERFDRVVDIFPALGERRRQRAGSLSGGERQMVAMGRALMMEPSVLLLDEPSAGLAPGLQDEVFVRVKAVNATGVTVIMVEQNARRCLQIVDRGYVLDQGRNAYSGTGRSLANDPKVIELYLGTLAKT